MLNIDNSTFNENCAPWNYEPQHVVYKITINIAGTKFSSECDRYVFDNSLYKQNLYDIEEFLIEDIKDGLSNDIKYLDPEIEIISIGTY